MHHHSVNIEWVSHTYIKEVISQARPLVQRDMRANLGRNPCAPSPLRKRGEQLAHPYENLAGLFKNIASKCLDAPSNLDCNKLMWELH